MNFNPFVLQNLYEVYKTSTIPVCVGLGLLIIVEHSLTLANCPVWPVKSPIIERYSKMNLFRRVFYEVVSVPEICLS